MIDRGVGGLYPNGSTGEFLRFDLAERRRIADITIEQAAGRVPVMAGVAEPTVGATLQECRRYAERGAAAVAAVSPFYYRLSEDAVFAWFAAIAGDSPLDVMLYHIPLFASPITVSTVRRLAEECPRVVGIKDSSGEIANMTALVAAVAGVRPEFTLMTGWDTTLVPMLLSGADGGTNASANVVPEVTAALYDAVQRGDLETAWQIQRALTPFFDAMLSPDFPIGFRLAMRLRGLDVGLSRLPQTPGQVAGQAAVMKDLEAALEGLRPWMRD